VRDKVNFQMLGEGNAYNTGDFSGGAYTPRPEKAGNDIAPHLRELIGLSLS
jgi:hypothetical protein